MLYAYKKRVDSDLSIVLPFLSFSQGREYKSISSRPRSPDAMHYRDDRRKRPHTPERHAYNDSKSPCYRRESS